MVQDLKVSVTLIYKSFPVCLFLFFVFFFCIVLFCLFLFIFILSFLYFINFGSREDIQFPFLVL